MAFYFALRNTNSRILISLVHNSAIAAMTKVAMRVQESVLLRASLRHAAGL